MDITYFMSWFLNQVLGIFEFAYNTLNNIEFAGTSLLKVLIFLNVIIPFLYLVITIPSEANAYDKGYREGHKEKMKAAKQKGKKK